MEKDLKKFVGFNFLYADGVRNFVWYRDIHILDYLFCCGYTILNYVWRKILGHDREGTIFTVWLTVKANKKIKTISIIKLIKTELWHTTCCLPNKMTVRIICHSSHFTQSGKPNVTRPAHVSAEPYNKKKKKPYLLPTAPLCINKLKQT